MLKKGFSYIGVFFLTTISFLPMWLLHLIARSLYYPLYYIVGYRKKVVRENLTRSFPEKNKAEIQKIEKKFFKYFADLMFETIKLASISKKELRKRVTFKDTSLVDSYLNKGQSVLMAASHYCNWELYCAGYNLKGDCYVIYKPLSNAIFGKWFYKVRTRFGNRFVTMNQTSRSLMATKNDLTIYCFATDQTPIKHEIQYSLPFLNQSTPVFLGLEKIALKTNRPVFCVDVKLLKRGYYEVDFVPLCLHPQETSEHQITHNYFTYLEKVLRQEPAYWLWSHRRWKYATQTN